jgi:uncharacterized membrane protein YfcA
VNAPQAVAADAPRARVALPVQALWAAAAFVSSLCGIGGGLFAVPLLHYLGRLPLRRAVASSLCLVFTLSLTATSVELFHDRSGLRAAVVLPLIAGGYLGARVGMGASERIDVRVLKGLFVIVLLFAAARIFALPAFAGAAAAGDVLTLAPATTAIVLAIGFGGGFVAPLLGVGGGLLVIPALFLSLPALSYIEARACSMAMTIFVSVQSAQAYWRRGEIELAQVRGLLPATVVGALGGVLAVHQDGWVEGARVTMGMVLVGIALRFAGDVLRGERRPSAAGRRS